MKKPFRYGRIQRVREIEEELAREEFLTRERIARHAEQAADNMQAEIDRAVHELSETRAYKRVPPHELLTAQTTLENLDATVAEQRRRARDLRAEAETMRAAWETSRAGVKTLERLEERFDANAREEERLAETKELDERALRPDAEVLADDDSDPWEAGRGPRPHTSSFGTSPDDDQDPLHAA